MEKIIEVKNLTKEYKKGVKAVDDLSLNVFKGEILGLLGPNGSGKSTTINCILSLLKYSSGSIKVFGKDMNPNSYDINKSALRNKNKDKNEEIRVENACGNNVCDNVCNIF